MTVIIDESTYLEHYGVKGMQWGVRKEERKVKRQAKREKKAEKFDKLAEQYQAQINKINQTKTRTSYGRRRAANLKKDLEKLKTRAENDAEAKRQGKLSSGQKKVIKGAAAAAAIVAAYGAYTMLQNGDFHRKSVKGKEFLTGKKFSWKKNLDLAKPDLDEDAIYSSVVKKINPKYGELGTKMNCRRCTFAYEMRRRGYDVTATRTTNARGQDVSGLYNVTNPGKKLARSGRGGLITTIVREQIGRKDSPVTDFITEAQSAPIKFLGKNKTHPLTLFDDLAKLPNGARGELTVAWEAGGGHSMAWEVIRGKPVIFDTQTGKRYRSLSDIASGLPSISQSAYTRLDNVPLNEDFLLRWLKDA